MADDRIELAPVLSTGRFVVGAALLFLFVQLAADIIVLFAVRADSRGVSQGAAYPVGLIVLLIGAALLVTAAIASRPRPEVVAGASDGQINTSSEKELKLDEKIETAKPHTEAEVSVRVVTGVQPPGEIKDGSGGTS